MKLKKLCEEAYQTATYNGFYDNSYEYDHFACLIISELMELVQADRQDRHVDPLATEDFDKVLGDEEFAKAFEHHVHNCFEDEMADVCIRIFSLSRYMNIDLEERFRFRAEFSFCNRQVLTEDIYKIVGIFYAEKPEQALPMLLWNMEVMAAYYHIDLYQFIHWKMRYNKLRGFLHGAKY